LRPGVPASSAAAPSQHSQSYAPQQAAQQQAQAQQQQAQQAQYAQQQQQAAAYAAQQQAQYAAQLQQAQYYAQQTQYAQQQAQYAAAQHAQQAAQQAAQNLQQQYQHQSYPQQQAGYSQQGYPPGYAPQQAAYQQQQAQGYYGYAQQAAPPKPLSPAQQIALAQKKRRKITLIIMGAVLLFACIGAVTIIVKQRNVSFDAADVVAQNAVAKHLNKTDGKFEVRRLVGSSVTTFVVVDKSGGGAVATYYRVELSKPLLFTGWSVGSVSTITSVNNEENLKDWAPLQGFSIEPVK
jgi:hypothetical protein